MVTIKNTTNQPICLNLPGARSLKIRARTTAEVEERDLESPEMAVHLGRRHLVALKRAAPSAKPAGTAAPAGKPAKAAAKPAPGQTKTTGAKTEPAGAPKSKPEKSGAKAPQESAEAPPVKDA